MTHCPLREKCAFLEDETFQQMRGLIRRYQESYCQRNFSDCARHQVASVLGDSSVPLSMMPTQIEWANQILSESKSET